MTRRETKTLPPLEDPQRSRHLTAQGTRREILSPPLNAESTSLPSLHQRRSLLNHKPIVVTFVRNGDKYFEGVKVNITQRNMRNWESLLSELSRRIDLPAGVRNVYTPNGGHRIQGLSQLEHQKTYVCGSTEPFKRMDYANVKNPDWKTTKPRVSETEMASVFSLPPPLDQSLNSTMRSFGTLDLSIRNWMESSSDKSGKKSRRVSDKPKSMRLVSMTEPQQESAGKSPEEPFNQSIRSLSGPNFSTTTASQHKVLMIYRNAPAEKRECVKIYLNKKMIRSWEDAKHIISENLKTINGYLRLYDLDGKEIESLSQLWSAGAHLIAAGREKFSLSKFLLGIPEYEGPREVHPESSVATPTSSWSAPPLLPVLEPVHTSPRRAILKGRPLPVIQETTPSTVENPSRNHNPQSDVQKNTSVLVDDPNDGGQDCREDNNRGVTEIAVAKIPGETSLLESVKGDAGRKSEYLDTGQMSDKGQNSSESDILGQEFKKASVTKTVTFPSSHIDEEDDNADVKYHNIADVNSPAAEQSISAIMGQDSTGVRSQDGELSTNAGGEHDGMYASVSDNTTMAEDKPDMSTSSSDVSLPNRRDSMYVHHHFPPSPSSVELNTPSSSPSMRIRRKRQRRMSLLQELQNGNLSRMSDSSSITDVQISPQRVFPRGQELLPHTPLSEVSLGVVQSVVDMVLPELQDCSDSSLISISPVSRLPTSRTIAIQTNCVDDQLLTTMEAEEILDQQNNSDAERTRSGRTLSLDGSAAAALLYKRSRDRYRVGMVIEEGAFAAVKSCSSKEDGRDYLLRVIQKGKVFGRDDKILHEIKIMRMLRNENVMGMVDYWESSNEHCMVMEPIKGGDLYDAILHCQHFSEADAMSCARQLGLAMVYLHANMIVHRSIKPENIFLTLEPNRMWTLKLAGFSLATIATEPLTLECSNEYYRAPEMTSGRGYGAKADVWSAGIITYILLSGVMPFSKKKKAKTHLSFPKCYWGNISSEAKDFVLCLLRASPCERYSSSQLLQHSWFKMLWQSCSDPNLSETLIKHLTAQAKMEIAPVLMLTETALNPVHSVRRPRGTSPIKKGIKRNPTNNNIN